MALVSTRAGMSEVDLSSADFSDLAGSRMRSANESRIKLTLDGDVAILRGDFEFNKKGQLIGGEITSIDFGFGPYDGVKFSDISINIKALSKASATSSLADDRRIFEKMFAGDDEINGGFQNDDLRGGAGNDTLFGGEGGDDLHGGAGADIFHYTDIMDSFPGQGFGVDKIDDFSQTEGDKIDLRDIDNFSFDDLIITQANGETTIEAESFGYSIVIELVGTINLTASDFIL